MEHNAVVTLLPVTTGEVTWSPLHTGVFTCMPGTSSGSQCVEAFHAHWEPGASKAGFIGESGGVTSAMRILTRLMPGWSGKFDFAGTPCLSLLGTEDARLIAGTEHLRNQGESNASEHMSRPTSRFICGDGKGTAYVVMHAQPPANSSRLPHEIDMDESEARLLVETICADVSGCAGLVASMGVWGPPPYNQLRTHVMRECCLHKCVVISGARAQSHWNFSDRLCTCQRFALRGQCQHVIVARSLDLPGVPADMRLL